VSYKYPEPDYADEYYPGSTKRIPAKVEPPKPETSPKTWDSRPLVRNVRGVPTELFTIGHLAQALNRRPVTIRKWEANRWLPRAGYVLPGATVHGNRRLYTRAQVEGLIQIARDEHILDDPQSLRTPITTTRFAERAFHLWKDLREGNP
jgi:hypothetical protein